MTWRDGGSTAIAARTWKVARFVERCLGPSAKQVLDVGCGTGILLPHFGQDGTSREIVELDLAESMLLENRKKPDARIAVHVCAEAQRPPFRDGSFDRVICFNALPHFTPLDASLQQMLNCLRPGGLLCIGHSMGSEQLNQFTRGSADLWATTRLPAARILGRLLSTIGAEVLCAEDENGWYCVQARKR